ncbi:MAG: ATP-binding cassette domain-containing protein, partial [Methylococcales bacterium]
LKLFGQAWPEVDHINSIADGFREKTMAVLRIAFLSSAVLEFFSTVAVALVAVYTGLSLLGQIHFGPEQTISFRQALFVLLLAPEFFLPLRQLAVYYHDRAAALGAADSLLTILVDTQPTTFEQAPDTFAGSACLLELVNVSKRYGQRQVLADINLQIQIGEKIALIGESGAGKTTLCNLLLGFEAASSGQIFLHGQPINQTLACKAIAWSGQQATIFHGSIEDNIALGNINACAADIHAAAKAARVTEFSLQLPQGLQTQIGERGFGISGGQAQRIALARVFLKNTELILLDEPTANLDSENKTLLLDTIERLFADKTLIIATHDADVIQRMHRRIELAHGRLQP